MDQNYFHRYFHSHDIQEGWNWLLCYIAMLEKKVLIILAVSLPLLTILSFSINVVLPVDKTLSKKNRVTVSQILLLSVMFFSLRYYFCFILLINETTILLVRILFSVFVGPILQKIVREFRPMHYCNMLVPWSNWNCRDHSHAVNLLRHWNLQ